jgi:hypothetical protein
MLNLVANTFNADPRKAWDEGACCLKGSSVNGASLRIAKSDYAQDPEGIF